MGQGTSNVQLPIQNDYCNECECRGQDEAGFHTLNGFYLTNVSQLYGLHYHLTSCD